MNINTSTFKFLDMIVSFTQKETQYMLREHSQGWPGIYHTYIKNTATFSSFYAASELRIES